MRNMTTALVGALISYCAPALAQTVVPVGGLTTANATSDQAALCQPNSRAYPAQFTWSSSVTPPPPRCNAR